MATKGPCIAQKISLIYLVDYTWFMITSLTDSKLNMSFLFVMFSEGYLDSSGEWLLSFEFGGKMARYRVG